MAELVLKDEVYQIVGAAGCVLPIGQRFSRTCVARSP